MSACLAQTPLEVQRRWMPGLFLIQVAGALSPLDYVVAGMARHGLGCEAIRLYLRLSCDAFDGALARLGLARPHERPLPKPHPRAWGLIEVWKLIALWIAGMHPATIGVLLGRTEGSVRSKAYRTGLPRRDRKLLIRDLATAARVGVAAASGAALAQLAAPVSAPLAGTSAPTSQDARPPARRSGPAQAPGVAAGGTNVVALPGAHETPAAPQTRAETAAARKTLQRPAGQLELPVHGIITSRDTAIAAIERRSNNIRLPVNERSANAGARSIGREVWTYERKYEVSHRAIAKQHPRRIAEEMGVSYSAVQTILWRVSAPRGYRKEEFVDAYDPERAEAIIKEGGYEFVTDKSVPRGSRSEDSSLSKEWFWRRQSERRDVRYSPLDRCRKNRLIRRENGDSYACSVAY